MKKNYTDYNIQDFLKDSYFLAWMRNDSPEINAFWLKWQREHPGKAHVITEAKEQYKLLVSFDSVNISLVEYEGVWNSIQDRLEDHTQRKRKKVLHVRIIRWSAVAAFFLLFIGGWVIYREKQAVENGIVVVQAANHKRQIVLADSSVVVLNAYATLKYYPDNCRELWLKGAAFFDVNHQGAAQRKADPFIVHAGEEKIAVLGTAFTVKTVKNVAWVVLLRGKVKTLVQGHIAIMKPGEKVKWENGRFYSEQVNPQLYTAWKDGEFHFDHTSLKEIKELVKDLYGYNLIVKNSSSLHTRTISGTVTATNEDVLWKTMALIFHAKIEKEGMNIILTIDN